ncbi:MAG: PAS domain S-box protein [Desulfarculaceae bacterium]|nr:PAS domain S-box protein [Desulfarculaceae bacterium]MCF8071631.1 PAS domain S-box protein [Desulfarculaceae bacterium]MCF8103172.1 PAS domain S-box protein [Desulfarculaceae bacterium]MCF8114910.1 PAS domain S-box protein [Desulfarculaceae bacterium]
MAPTKKTTTPGHPLDPDRGLNRQEVIRGIIDSMSDGLMVIDHEGEIVFTNPALGDILGMTREQIMGRGWGELFFDDPANDEFNQVIVEVITERIYHYNRQVSYRFPDGQRKELIVTTTLLPCAGGGEQVGGVLVMFKDVSELTQINRHSQELLRHTRRLYQEKIEGLDRIARAVAHEIRNPVTTIGGLATRLLADKSDNSRDARYLRRILSGTERLEHIVEEVRAYADLPQPVRRPGEVKSWLRKEVRPYRNQARERGVRLSVGGTGNNVPPIQAEFDPQLLGRVLDILLMNALEATPKGGSIKISLMCDEISVVIAVSDTGKGLNPADLPYVFDPFFTTKTDAVGMSLAIAKRIATEHQGDLSVVSHGRGATFTLTVPQDGVYEENSDQDARPPELK